MKRSRTGCSRRERRENCGRTGGGPGAMGIRNILLEENLLISYLNPALFYWIRCHPASARRSHLQRRQRFARLQLRQRLPLRLPLPQRRSPSACIAELPVSILRGSWARLNSIVFRCCWSAVVSLSQKSFHLRRSRLNGRLRVCRSRE